jgi:uncharacterized membrane protein HdeD (DUF308 family)
LTVINVAASARGYAFGAARPASAAARSTTMSSTASATTPSPTADDLEALREILRQNWWMIAIRGVLGILFGLVALFLPGITMLSLVLVFAAYMLVDGAFCTYAAFKAMRQRERWGWLLLQGLASIAAAVIAVIWPGITVIAFVILIAAWAIVSGCLMLAAAYRLDKEHGRWWLVFSGVVSLLYGALLVIAPVIGAIVLTWWIGAFSLVFGVLLLALAFKLRARRSERPRTKTAAQAA